MEMMKVMEESIEKWGVGGRIEWIGLAFSYQRLLRASESVAMNEGRRGTGFTA